MELLTNIEDTAGKTVAHTSKIADDYLYDFDLVFTDDTCIRIIVAEHGGDTCLCVASKSELSLADEVRLGLCAPEAQAMHEKQKKYVEDLVNLYGKDEARNLLLNQLDDV